MINEILLAIIQGITEFLPVSSSGHLALLSNIISEPNLFFMVVMHFASLLAIIIFFKTDLIKLSNFTKSENWHWYKIILIGILPAGLVGFFFSDLIDLALNSYFFIGTGFLITTLILLSSKLRNGKKKNISIYDSLIIGIAQIIALFPGVSRSGTTTSVGIMRKINPSDAGKFSFLLFIPLMIGAMIFKLDEFYFDFNLIIAFAVCFLVSLGSLKLFFNILKNNKLWLFAVWTSLMAITSFILGVL